MSNAIFHEGELVDCSFFAWKCTLFYRIPLTTSPVQTDFSWFDEVGRLLPSLQRSEKLHSALEKHFEDKHNSSVTPGSSQLPRRREGATHYFKMIDVMGATFEQGRQS